jgi:hypothetical protein
MVLASGIAFAHEKTFDSTITLSRHPSGTIRRDARVTFEGKVSSPKDACESNRTVKLVRIGKGVVDKTKTGAAGRYEFVRRVKSDSEWRTKVTERELSAQHPHVHICAKDKSPKKRINVR